MSRPVVRYLRRSSDQRRASLDPPLSVTAVRPQPGAARLECQDGVGTEFRFTV